MLKEFTQWSFNPNKCENWIPYLKCILIDLSLLILQTQSTKLVLHFLCKVALLKLQKIKWNCILKFVWSASLLLVGLMGAFFLRRIQCTLTLTYHKPQFGSKITDYQAFSLIGWLTLFGSWRIQLSRRSWKTRCTIFVFL